MSEERIVQLLEEIRDLQKQNAENYKLAIARQEEAIALQKNAVSRVRTVLLAVVLVLILLVAVPLIGWGSAWLSYCLRR